MAPPRSSRAMPAGIHWLLVAAGWLLPPGLRRDWLREWYAEFWHSLGPAGTLRRQWTRALGAFPDAWCLLRQDYGIGRRLRDTANSRFAPALLLVLLIAATAMMTDGFGRARNLLFHDDSAGLVLVTQPLPFMGGSARIPAAQADAWLQAGQTIAALGRWSIEGRVCRVDRPAFTLLSEAPVKPPCERIEPALGNVPSYAGVVARLKGGATIHEAEEELAATEGAHKGWVRPAIVPLAAVRKAPLAPVGSVLFGLTLLSTLAVRALTIRAWIWAVSRIVLSFALISGVWMELVGRAPFTQTAGRPGVWNALLYLMPLIAGGFAAWRLRRDTRRRCRTCYRALAMPVLVGMPGSCLFEPGGTEYLCVAGHGALLAGPVGEPMGGEVWAIWSDSWD